VAVAAPSGVGERTGVSVTSRVGLAVAGRMVAVGGGLVAVATAVAVGEGVGVKTAVAVPGAVTSTQSPRP